MKLAYVSAPGRGETDALIAQVVAMLERESLRLAGTVRSAQVAQGHPCDMDLRVLPDGPDFRISQPLGKAARGCRLDGGIIETIAALVEARLEGADLLIINKFGKQEAQGRGLCPAIARAIELEIPVLVGVNELNMADFLTFASGTAAFPRPDAHIVLDWIRATIGSGRRSLRPMAAAFR